jgi:tripartite-type tricarboxylate transporter receptor subunit TctC
LPAAPFRYGYETIEYQNYLFMGSSAILGPGAKTEGAGARSRGLLMLKPIVTALLAMSAFAAAADPQTYPERPARIIVGFAAGTSADMSARLMGQWLSQRLGQQFVIENRPGAGSNIATETVVNAPPDGYTLLLVSMSNAINATLYKNLNYNFIRDIVPVAGIVREPTVMEVNPSVPAKTVPEFIAYAKANPGRINMGSSGVGSVLYAAGALFALMARVDMVHVPYPAAVRPLTGLLAGEIQVMFGPIASSIEHVKAGKLRALAVTTATRSALLPDSPTVGEYVPGYEASNWFGIALPRNTPAGIAEKLNKEINAGLADPKMRKWFADMGGEPMPMAAADFGKFIASETDKWGQVAGFSGAKPD